VDPHRRSQTGDPTRDYPKWTPKWNTQKGTNHTVRLTGKPPQETPNTDPSQGVHLRRPPTADSHRRPPTGDPTSDPHRTPNTGVPHRKPTTGPRIGDPQQGRHRGLTTGDHGTPQQGTSGPKEGKLIGDHGTRGPPQGSPHSEPPPGTTHRGSTTGDPPPTGNPTQATPSRVDTHPGPPGDSSQGPTTGDPPQRTPRRRPPQQRTHPQGPPTGDPPQLNTQRGTLLRDPHGGRSTVEPHRGPHTGGPHRVPPGDPRQWTPQSGPQQGIPEGTPTWDPRQWTSHSGTPTRDAQTNPPQETTPHGTPKMGQPKGDHLTLGPQGLATTGDPFTEDSCQGSLSGEPTQRTPSRGTLHVTLSEVDIIVDHLQGTHQRGPGNPPWGNSGPTTADKGDPHRGLPTGDHNKILGDPPQRSPHRRHPTWEYSQATHNSGPPRGSTHRGLVTVDPLTADPLMTGTLAIDAFLRDSFNL
jgi:hypothetical protein